MERCVLLSGDAFGLNSISFSDREIEQNMNPA